MRVERHVRLAEQYPFMQREGWLRHHVLDAGDVAAAEVYARQQRLGEESIGFAHAIRIEALGRLGVFLAVVNYLFPRRRQD